MQSIFTKYFGHHNCGSNPVIGLHTFRKFSYNYDIILMSLYMYMYKINFPVCFRLGKFILYMYMYNDISND